MAGYCNLGDVAGRLPFALSATSRPTADQVELFIAQRSAELDAALRSRGLAVPVTDPAWLPEATGMAAKAAAGDALLTAFPADAGPGSSALGPQLLREYNNRLDQIRKGIGVPVGQPVSETDAAPLSAWTDDTSGSDPTLPGNRPHFFIGQRFG